MFSFSTDIYQSQSYVSLPFQLLSTQHILVPLKINGQHTHFIIDTGAGESCLDAGFAQKINLNISASSVQAVGFANQHTIHYHTRLRHLQLGSWTSIDMPFSVLDFSHISNALNPLLKFPLAGILGADFLIEQQASIDYGQQKLYLHDHIVDFEIGETNHILLKSKINKKNEVYFILDTGANQSCFNYPLAGDLGLVLQKIKQESSGLGETEVTKSDAIANTFQIGEWLQTYYSFAVLDLQEIQKSLRHLSKVNIDGILGADLFIDYKVVIDYAKQQLYLKKEKSE
ncbi:MAG: retropepsin-like aspartic protease [Chitinophagales bacterium]